MISVANQSKYRIQWKNFQDDVSDYQPTTKPIQRRRATIRNCKQRKNQQSTQLSSSKELLSRSGWEVLGLINWYNQRVLLFKSWHRKIITIMIKCIYVEILSKSEQNTIWKTCTNNVHMQYVCRVYLYGQCTCANKYVEYCTDLSHQYEGQT